MKLKGLCLFVLLIVLVAAVPLGAAAEDNGKLIHVTGPNTVITTTIDDVVGGAYRQTARAQRSYWREVRLWATHEKYNPSFYDWPQKIYHSEPNPYAPGNAHGNLTLQGFYRAQSGTNTFYVIYAGYMYYYD